MPYLEEPLSLQGQNQPRLLRVSISKNFGINGSQLLVFNMRVIQTGDSMCETMDWDSLWAGVDVKFARHCIDLVSPDGAATDVTDALIRLQVGQTTLTTAI